MSFFKFIFVCLFIASSSVLAQGMPSKVISFQGQTGEELSLETVKTETRYREEMRDSTCTRQVPYQTTECRNETRYRQECRWEEGRNRCWTDYERQCRTTPGRQVCRNTPPRQDCRTRPDGRRICRSVPGRRVCRTVPGRRICNQVPRQRCEWEPGRNICRQVPYQERVCREVTRYREETYACRRAVRVPYQVTKRVVANVSVNFEDKTRGAMTDFTARLTPNGDMEFSSVDTGSVMTLTMIDKQLSRNVNDQQDSINGVINLTILNKKKRVGPLMKQMKLENLGSQEFTISTGKIFKKKQITIFVRVMKMDRFGNTREVLNVAFKGDRLQIEDRDGRSFGTFNFSDRTTLGSGKYKVFMTAKLKALPKPVVGEQPVLVQNKEFIRNL